MSGITGRFSGIRISCQTFALFPDFTRLPFITRRDLSLNYPYDMFAVPLREVVRLHTASINFEDPIVIGFTENDISSWAGSWPGILPPSASARMMWFRSR
ncbi:MAG: hypothetical protein R2860_04980 [Desulfobacterales bacterium]